MIIYNGIKIKTPEELEEVIKNLSPFEKQSVRDDFHGRPKNTALTQEEKDFIKYQKRAQAKDRILAEMATENMSRIRRGIWTVPDLVALTQDPNLKAVLDDIQTLSFELAVTKLMQNNNPIVTPAIKNQWITKLQSHFYNE
jgi:hypothetical protein